MRSGRENSARPEALALSLDYNVPTDVLVRETDREKRRVLFTNSSGRTVRLIVVCSGYSRYTSLSFTRCTQKGTFIISLLPGKAV